MPSRMPSLEHALSGGLLHFWPISHPTLFHLILGRTLGYNVIGIHTTSYNFDGFCICCNSHYSVNA